MPASVHTEFNTAMIGESSSMQAMLEDVSLLAGVDRPVLVLGERGTGKELVATRLHYLSPRWEEPLVKVNCAALTESLLETELFGHESGAFTGAQGRRAGLFERAHRGTLVLDELATISPRVQEKILRVIESGTFDRVGGSQTVHANVRVVGASNENLVALARAGRFRWDLLDRLAFAVVRVPPLRERAADILLLAEHFARCMTREMGREYFAGFSRDAKRALLTHQWPGNVRELKNVVERSMFRHDIVSELLGKLVFDPFANLGLNVASTEDSLQHQPCEVVSASNAATKLQPRQGEFLTQLSDIERDLLQRALEINRFHQRSTANFLGITYDSLRGLLRKHHLGKNR